MKTKDYQIASDDMRSILEDLGYKLIDDGQSWRAQALYRNGSNSTSLIIYKNTGVWKDFGQDSEYLPFVSLVQKTLGDNNPDILKKIQKNHNFSLQYKEKERERALLKDEKIYPDDCLTRLLPHYDFYTSGSKNISEDTLKKYECGLATAGKLYRRLVFPIRNKERRIHGFSGRTVVDNNVKWLNLGKKSNWIYPYFNVEEIRESIQKTRSVFIVESIGDSLSLFERGVKNNLVCFGLSIQPKLLSFLSFLDVDKIYISLNNNENAIRAGLQNLLKLTTCIDPEVLYFAPPITEDFGDMVKEEQTEEFLSYINDLTLEENWKELHTHFNELLLDHRVSDRYKKIIKKLQKDL